MKRLVKTIVVHNYYKEMNINQMDASVESWCLFIFMIFLLAIGVGMGIFTERTQFWKTNLQHTCKILESCIHKVLRSQNLFESLRNTWLLLDHKYLSHCFQDFIKLNVLEALLVKISVSRISYGKYLNERKTISTKQISSRPKCRMLIDQPKPVQLTNTVLNKLYGQQSFKTKPVHGF